MKIKETSKQIIFIFIALIMSISFVYFIYEPIQTNTTENIKKHNVYPDWENKIFNSINYTTTDKIIINKKLTQYNTHMGGIPIHYDFTTYTITLLNSNEEISYDEIKYIEYDQKPYVTYQYIPNNITHPDKKYTINKGYYNITLFVPKNYLDKLKYIKN